MANDAWRLPDRTPLLPPPLSRGPARPGRSLEEDPKAAITIFSRRRNQGRHRRRLDPALPIAAGGSSDLPAGSPGGIHGQGLSQGERDVNYNVDNCQCPMATWIKSHYTPCTPLWEVVVHISLFLVIWLGSRFNIRDKLKITKLHKVRQLLLIWKGGLPESF